MSGEDRGLAVRKTDGLIEQEESTGELAASKGAAEVVAAIQAAMTVAKRFPRDEIGAMTKLTRSCLRTTFAEDAIYSFPRGGSTVSGPSVKLAREAARCWGNMESGMEVIRDTEQDRQIRVWAWDLETNTKSRFEDTFTKRIYRKGKGGQGGAWVDVSTDERELRELTNRRAAILERNCILKLIPSDVVEEAIRAVYKTLAAGAAKDPDGQRKAVALAFADLGISSEEIAKYLGKPLGQAGPAEIADLRTIYASIRDGNSRWSEYVGQDDAKAPIQTPKAKVDPDSAKAETPPAPAAAPTDKAAAPSVDPTPTEVAERPEREPGEDEVEEEPVAEPAPVEPARGTVECSDRQIRLLFAIGRGAGMKPNQVKELCREKYSCEIDEISRENFNRFLEVLKTRSQGG